MSIRCLFILFAIAIVQVVYGYDIECASLSVLVEEARVRDRMLWRVSGEVVGEPLHAGGGVWLNLLEAGNALAVFCPESMAASCAALIGGTHARRGHLIRVTGELRRLCEEHGGDHDFHAHEIVVVGESMPTADTPSFEEILVFAALLVMTAVLGMLFPPAASGTIWKAGSAET